MQKVKVIYKEGKQKMVLYRYKNNTIVGIYGVPLVLWRSLLDKHKHVIPVDAKIRIANPNEGAEDILMDAYTGRA
jgi:hypothetical protein